MGNTQRRELGATAANWPTFIEFSRDEFAHPDSTTEFWWLTSRLSAGDRVFGAQIFVLAVPGEPVIVSTCLTDLLSGTHESHVARLPLEGMTLATDRLEVRTETASLTGSFSHEAHLRARVSEHDDFDLLMRPTSPILRYGGGGAFPLGGAITWEYAVPALTTAGRVTFGGQAFDVTGVSWLDRQWFDKLNPNALQDLKFTWMAICLDNGDNLGLWNEIAPGLKTEPWVTAAHPDGAHTISAASLMPRRVAQGAYPSGWTVRIPSLGAELNISTTKLHELPGGAWYSGILEVGGTYRDQQISGYGFVDLVGWNQEGRSE